MKVFVIAGEESGDILGAGVMASLNIQVEGNDITYRGIGGIRMQKAGLKSLFPMEELSLMGIAEILPKVPHLLSHIKQTIDAIEIFQPDVLLTIDSPDFCFRVAKGLKKRGINIPVKAHYVAPTVWAWRPGRAKKIAALYDVIFCLFPFEPPYFEKEGLEAIFVGHPAVEIRGENLELKKEEFLKSHDIPDDALKLGVFFGSRRSELRRMGRVFVEAIQSFIRCHPDQIHRSVGEEADVEGSGFKDRDNTIQARSLDCARDDIVLIAPTLPHLKEQVEELLQPLSCQKLIITDKDQKYPAMAACDLAIATSGTVGLELSVLGVQHLIGYKMNPLTYEIGKRLVTTEYAHLTNILLQEEVVPEFIQQECTPEKLVEAMDQMIQIEPVCTDQGDTFVRVREMINPSENKISSQICAEKLIKKLSAS